jgi:hypothetical protein
VTSPSLVTDPRTTLFSRMVARSAFMLLENLPKSPCTHLTTLFYQTWATATSAPTSRPSFYGPCQSRQHPFKPLCHPLHQDCDKRRPRRFKSRVDLWWRLQSRTWIDGFRRSRFTPRERVWGCVRQVQYEAMKALLSKKGTILIMNCCVFLYV